MNKKKQNNEIVHNQDGFIRVPTYLFPGAFELSKEIDLKEENKQVVLLGVSNSDEIYLDLFNGWSSKNEFIFDIKAYGYEYFADLLKLN